MLSLNFSFFSLHLAVQAAGIALETRRIDILRRAVLESVSWPSNIVLMQLHFMYFFFF